MTPTTKPGECGSPPETGITLADALNHARSLFEYHAGQRWTAIRYYIVAYSIFATAYFRMKTNDSLGSIEELEIAALCIVSLVVSICFFLLDIRNSELVEVDEIALKELEKKAAAQIGSGPHPKISQELNITCFQITEAADVGIDRYHDQVQYKYILIVLFLTFILCSAAATIESIAPFFCP